MAGFDEQAATTFLESTVGLAVQSQWAAASEEEALQECLNQMRPQILTCHSLDGNKTYAWYAATLRHSSLPCDVAGITPVTSVAPVCHSAVLSNQLSCAVQHLA